MSFDMIEHTTGLLHKGMFYCVMLWSFFLLSHFAVVEDYKYKSSCQCAINPIQDGLFRGCSRMAKNDLPKICHTYPTMMKLGSYTLPKEDPKNI